MIFPPQPDGVFGFTQIPRVWTASRGTDPYRRGLYVHFWCAAMAPAPDATPTYTRRNRSTTPMQTLTLLNDPTYVDLARGPHSPNEPERWLERARPHPGSHAPR